MDEGPAIGSSGFFALNWHLLCLFSFHLNFASTCEWVPKGAIHTFTHRDSSWVWTPTAPRSPSLSPSTFKMDGGPVCFYNNYIILICPYRTWKKKTQVSSGRAMRKNKNQLVNLGCVSDQQLDHLACIGHWNTCSWIWRDTLQTGCSPDSQGIYLYTECGKPWLPSIVKSYQRSCICIWKWDSACHSSSQVMLRLCSATSQWIKAYKILTCHHLSPSYATG